MKLPELIQFSGILDKRFKFKLNEKLPDIASSTRLLSLNIYVEVIKKNTPPIISTKQVMNNAYCSDSNWIVSS